MLRLYHQLVPAHQVFHRVLVVHLLLSDQVDHLLQVVLEFLHRRNHQEIQDVLKINKFAKIFIPGNPIGPCGHGKHGGGSKTRSGIHEALGVEPGRPEAPSGPGLPGIPGNPLSPFGPRSPGTQQALK